MKKPLVVEFGISFWLVGGKVHQKNIYVKAAAIQ
jgi:hypothetical protein